MGGRSIKGNTSPQENPIDLERRDQTPYDRHRETSRTRVCQRDTPRHLTSRSRARSRHGAQAPPHELSADTMRSATDSLRQRPRRQSRGDPFADRLSSEFRSLFEPTANRPREPHTPLLVSCCPYSVTVRVALTGDRLFNRGAVEPGSSSEDARVPPARQCRIRVWVASSAAETASFGGAAAITAAAGPSRSASDERGVK